MNATVRSPEPVRLAVIIGLITSACVGCAQLGVGPRKSGGINSHRRPSATLPSTKATITNGVENAENGQPNGSIAGQPSVPDEQLREAAAAALLDPNRPTGPSPAHAPLGVADVHAENDPFTETSSTAVDRLLGTEPPPETTPSVGDPVTPVVEPAGMAPAGAVRNAGAFELKDAPDGPTEVAPVVKPNETPRPANTAVRAVIRGQSPNSPTPGTGDYLRYPMVPSQAPLFRGQGSTTSNFQPFPNGATGGQVVNPNDTTPILPEPGMDPNTTFQPFTQLPEADIDVFVEEARTGKFMFGAGVNSDLGVTGQIVIDERNFDPFRVPTSWDDVVNGTAWRGAGQGFRLEAMPGSQVQRYLVTHTMPYVYLFGIPEPFVLNTSGFYYTRNYFDWNEQRLGGRVALGYRITPDLSLTTAVRAEEVTIYNPRVVGLVPQLDRVVGDNELYSGRVTLTHDTRDNAFLATQGHYFEIAYEQTFGSFDYPRGELDYRQYFLMRERPDGSGRHTLAYSFRLGFSGSQTPIYENYFSGGYSTMRGFDFRGASPMGPAGVGIGGQFRFLGSVEYFFPLTADDMIKGVVFCDYGTTEAEIEMHSDNYRVSPGMGLRLNIPAMGPAPLALDFAVPVTRASTDNIQNFSFFFGFSR